MEADPCKPLIQVAYKCQWRFLDLENAFHSIVDVKDRLMYVYSDVVTSSIVGNKMVDLLREIPYKRTDKVESCFLNLVTFTTCLYKTL